MKRITSRFVLLIASAGGRAARSVRTDLGQLPAKWHPGIRQRGQPPGRQPGRPSVSELYFDNNVARPAIRRTRAAGYRSRRRGSRNGFSGTTSSTSPSSARSRCSTRRPAARDQPPRPVAHDACRDPASVPPSGVYIAPLEVDDDVLPTTVISVRLSPRQLDPAGSSRRSRSKNSGGWSIASASAARATRCWSPTTAASSPTATLTRNA